MPPLVYQIAGGSFFLPGAVLLMLAVLGGGLRRRRLFSILGMVTGLLGIVMITLSAAALPWWMYITWAIATIAWLCIGICKSGAARLAIRGFFLVCTLAAAGLQLSYQRLKPLPPANFQSLYVVGDSITAGLGRTGEKTWPAILRAERGIQIVDLSRAGCVTSQAMKMVKARPPQDGVVLIEIGGNDMLGKTKPEQFGADLDDLVKMLQGPRREIIMFELPLFPFDNAYGLEQRRVAREYRIRLIPRRFLANVLSAPGATVDGIHLSNQGQRDLSDLVWKAVGAALGGSKIEIPSPKR